MTHIFSVFGVDFRGKQRAPLVLSIVYATEAPCVVPYASSLAPRLLKTSSISTRRPAIARPTPRHRSLLGSLFLRAPHGGRFSLRISLAFWFGLGGLYMESTQTVHYFLIASSSSSSSSSNSSNSSVYPTNMSPNQRRLLVVPGIVTLVAGAVLSSRGGGTSRGGAFHEMNLWAQRKLRHQGLIGVDPNKGITQQVILAEDTSSFVPSDFPSMVPSDAPSLVPSDMPSLVPSIAPTALKSDYPSIDPMEWPETTSPPSPENLQDDMIPDDTDFVEDVTSTAPSDQPSLVPSVQPSPFLDLDGTTTRYYQQSCSVDPTPATIVTDDMQPIVVEYTYSLITEDGEDPRVVLGKVEDYFVRILRELFCTTGDTRRRGLSTDTIFSASPPDELSNQDCPVDLGEGCRLVKGATTVWLPTKDTLDTDSSSSVTCDVSEQIEFLIENDYLNTLSGVSSTQLESVTSCQTSQARDGSPSLERPYLVVCAGAVFVFLVGTLIRYIAIRRMKATVTSGKDNIDAGIVGVTASSVDSEITGVEKALSQKTKNAGADGLSWPSSKGSAGSEDLENSDNYEYEYYKESKPRTPIMVDSKLLSLTMKSIPETGSIVETSTEDRDGEKWETVELDFGNSFGSI